MPRTQTTGKVTGWLARVPAGIGENSTEIFMGERDEKFPDLTSLFIGVGVGASSMPAPQNDLVAYATSVTATST
jgi:hypothetical protein